MRVLNDNTESVTVKFSKKEFYQIQAWLIGQKFGNLEIEKRDTLENFIALSSWLNPEDEIKEILAENLSQHLNSN